MKNKVRNLLPITITLAGALVAISPTMTYAKQCADPFQFLVDVECQAESGEQSSTFTVNISPTISLDAVSTSGKVDVAPGESATGTLSAEVSSTGAFTVSLSAANPNLVHETYNDHVIPASANVQNGSTGWGVKKIVKGSGGADVNDSAYTALTTNPVVFYESSVPVSAKQFVFETGVSVDRSVWSGVYSTEITVTAATKQ